MKAYSLFMASQKGFEPPTPRLGGACSIQLSYWDKCHYSFFIPHLDPNDLPLRSTVFPFTVFAKGPILSRSVLFFAAFLKDSSHVVLPIHHLCQALLVPL